MAGVGEGVWLRGPCSLVGEVSFLEQRAQRVNEE